MYGISEIAAHLQEIKQMSKQTSKTKTKRPSKGQRTNVRRLKQEARAAGTLYKPATG